MLYVRQSCFTIRTAPAVGSGSRNSEWTQGEALLVCTMHRSSAFLCIPRRFVRVVTCSTIHHTFIRSPVALVLYASEHRIM